MARILIAEDEESVRSLVARALTLDGHEVTTANDGAAALDVLTRERRRVRAAAHRHPHAGDGRHRAGAGGGARPSRLAILLMTGYADQRERASGLDALIHDVITKPFSLATIRGAVSAALAGGRAIANSITHRISVDERSEPQ